MPCPLPASLPASRRPASRALRAKRPSSVSCSDCDSGEEMAARSADAAPTSRNVAVPALAGSEQPDILEQVGEARRSPRAWFSARLSA